LNSQFSVGLVNEKGELCASSQNVNRDELKVFAPEASFEIIDERGYAAYLASYFLLRLHNRKIEGEIAKAENNGFKTDVPIRIEELAKHIPDKSLNDLRDYLIVVVRGTLEDFITRKSLWGIVSEDRKNSRDWGIRI